MPSNMRLATLFPLLSGLPHTSAAVGSIIVMVLR